MKKFNSGSQFLIVVKKNGIYPVGAAGGGEPRLNLTIFGLIFPAWLSNWKNSEV